MAKLVLNQIIIMFLLMGTGAMLYKVGFLTEKSSKELGAILLYVVSPAITIKSFNTPFSHEKMISMIYCYLLCIMAFLIAIIFTEIIYRNKICDDKFAAVFCNCGFIGIPLVQSIFGNDALFYLIPYSTLSCFFMWTYGIVAISGDRKLASPAKVLKNPVVIAMFLGIIMFISGLHLPDVLAKTVDYISDLNTPVAMIVMGGYMIKVDWKKALTSYRIYANAFLRLILFPMITLAAMFFFRKVGYELICVLLLLSATPTAASAAILPPQIGRDPATATGMVCVSTVLSLLTLPLFMAVTEIVIKL